MCHVIFLEASFFEVTSPPLEKCALPVYPQDDLEVTQANGLRFGKSKSGLLVKLHIK